MSITYGSISSDGSTKSEKIIKDVTEVTTSCTYYPQRVFCLRPSSQSRRSLLWRRLPVEDIRSRGLIQGDSVFAGHPLGENSALAGLAEVMPIEFWSPSSSTVV
ncbi:unnamed protein product [Tuber melanosporum]|uniref:(Perigord truffle) hypothetical protein n=1 Tax=Tuber melanosporum (strain Mel28) TaxID=656061 RepID=D5GFR8_TUBMM|nr:uncharacterized protein GSTUM_00007040001 [Tuber melanosporum]CAZ83361.1 unnamed protein product [Tuber melanosporum]